VGEVVDPSRATAGWDGGAIVCTSRDWDTELAVPGGASTAAAALTAVTVSPTHRRRGLMRALVGRHLDAALERGQPLSALLASEYPIYGRFGYGPATEWQGLEVDASAAFREPAPPAGSLRLVDREVASGVLPGIFERARRAGVGDIRRSEGWWTSHLRDLPRWHGAAGARFYAVLEHDGEARGYVSYRIRDEWGAGGPRFELSVADLVGLDDAARAALWRYVLGVDLVATVRAAVPVDEPLPWLLADARRARVTGRGDGLWVRILDPGRALGARRYAASGRLAI
jgi:predicted acetyltransferase